MNLELLTTGILGLSGVVITVYYTEKAKALERNRMMKELFKEFNARYDAMNNTLLEVQDNYNTLQIFNALKDKDREKFNKIKYCINDYFNLCAEEHYWYKYKKLIDEAVWLSWSKGMNDYYNKVNTIRELWLDEINDKDGYISFYLQNGDSFFKSK